MLATSESHRHLRKKPIQARSRRTVESILEAADRVLRREGYEAASTNRIAQVAGYSVGSLYQYFADKESVVRTLIDRVLVREDELVAECLASQGGEPLESGVAAMIEFLLQSRWMDSHIPRILADEGAELGDTSALERILAVQSAVPAALQQLAIEHWDEIRRDDLAATLWVLMAATQAITFQAAARPQPDLSASSLLGPLSEVWTRALATPAPDHPLAEEVARAWHEAPGPSALPASHHGLAEMRALLLRASAPAEPDRLGPIALALACLPTLARTPQALRPGVDDASRDRELRIFAAALLGAYEGRRA